MFDRYTEDSRKVIFFARYEASRLGSPVLETGHLWLGLLRQNKKLMKRLAPKITVESIHQQLEPQDLNAERVSMTVEMPLSDAAKRALASATEEADGHGQKYITSEYLVLALLREEGLAP
jgi:ATP-dependent Clp protease ATP-binding subunit ClpC